MHYSNMRMYMERNTSWVVILSITFLRKKIFKKGGSNIFFEGGSCDHPWKTCICSHFTADLNILLWGQLLAKVRILDSSLQYPFLLNLDPHRLPSYLMCKITKHIDELYPNNRIKYGLISWWKLIFKIFWFKVSIV